MVETIDIPDLLGKSQYIPIDKCVIGKTQVEEDDELVKQIRRIRGIIHPVILQDLKNGQYKIIDGYRRVNAYRILKNEDSKYEKIAAFVIARDLTDAERKVLAWNEGMQQKRMTSRDYIDVIEYFYKKYGGGRQGIIDAAGTLGISVTLAKNYLREARLPDKIKKCIENREFTMGTALMALKALGDDEESVDEDILITTAKDLKLLTPSVRNTVANAMKQHPEWTQQQAEDYVKEQVQNKENIIQIELTHSQMKKLSEYAKRMQNENVEDMIMEIVDRGLTELEDDKS